MMKILTITNSYGANGAAALLRNISHYWIKELGWSVDALATNPVSQPDQELIEAAGICFLGDKAYLRPYDIVLINTLVDLQLIDKIPTTVRVVVWAHEGVSIAYNNDWSARQWHNKLARARLIIFQTVWQTETVYKSFLFNLPSSKVRIIPNGILPISHHGRLGRELGQKVKVVFVGAMTPLKQPLDLAKAIVNLRKKMEISCDFIGSKKHFPSLGAEAEQMASEHAQTLNWLGELHGEHLHQKISEADIFCHPSGDESFALAPLEAALLGLPVILANLQCYSHIGWVAEENCLMFPKGDVEVLAQQVERLTKNPELYQRISSKGKQLAQSMSWEVFCANMTAAMKHVQQL